MNKTISAIILCSFAGAADSAPVPQNLCDETIGVYYNQFTNVHANPPSLATAFDDDETTGVPVSEYGASIVLDFSGLERFKRKCSRFRLRRLRKRFAPPPCAVSKIV